MNLKRVLLIASVFLLGASASAQEQNKGCEPPESAICRLINDPQLPPPSGGSGGGIINGIELPELKEQLDEFDVMVPSTGR